MENRKCFQILFFCNATLPPIIMCVIQLLFFFSFLLALSDTLNNNWSHWLVGQYTCRWFNSANTERIFGAICICRVFAFIVK